MANESKTKKTVRPITRRYAAELLLETIDNYDPSVPIKEASINTAHYLKAVAELIDLYDLKKKRVVPNKPTQYDVDM